MRIARLLTPLVAAALVAALGAAPLAASPSGKIKVKQREAQVVLAQVNALDDQLGKTVEVLGRRSLRLSAGSRSS